jgi:hypothetical protein
VGLSDLTGPWQLFVDDYTVASKVGVTRTYHPFQKYASNPVMVADRDWEGANIYLYGTVLPDPAAGYCCSGAPAVREAAPGARARAKNAQKQDPRRSRRAWPIAFGQAWFALGLTPTSTILPLAELMTRNQVSWSVAGPDVPASITAQQFTFEIRASVPRKLENLGLPKSSDDSAFFAGFKLLPPPPPTTGTAKSGKGARPPAGKDAEAGPPAETAPPSNAPAGVGVAEVH